MSPKSNANNRLKHESSPYLLQHANNPVDWYPWGEEAFAEAKHQDKPILLSVGYSSCHWCHVMAHESFEDPMTAELMNRIFVNVKVDREERPDIDAIYMSALQAMTGSGGWPMTIVMTPEGKPFFAGTYFPPDDRFGRPSFQRIILSLAQAWLERRSEVYRSADNITAHVRVQEQFAAQDDVSAELVEKALATVKRNFDAKYGGFGQEPKFPAHSLLKWLLEQNDESQKMALFTLDKMALGGIYDQLAGGFARYSVDEIWLVPHFEKMLYDNAQLIQRYSEAYALTGKTFYKSIAEETLKWLYRDMADPEGGFYSALDADSEGEEGKYYLWDEDDIDALLGEDAKLAKAYWDISSMGNFEGRNILQRKYRDEAVAARFGISLRELELKVKGFKEVLGRARAQRIPPGCDDKILCSWNALMLLALVSAAQHIDFDTYLPLALKHAAFLEKTFYRQGRLWHSYKRGELKTLGLLEDYSYLGLAMLALYQLNFDSHHLEIALKLAETIENHFADPKGGFFSTPDDGEKLIFRPKDNFDSAIPSQNAFAATLLWQLARYNANRIWQNLAYQTLQPMVEAMVKQPSGFASWLALLELHLKPSQEIVIVGEADDKATKEMLALLRQHQLPHVSLALTGEHDPLYSQLALFQGRLKLQGKPTAYICENQSCHMPINDIEDFAKALKSLKSESVIAFKR